MATTTTKKYEELERLKAELDRKVDKLHAELNDAEKGLQAVSTTLELLKRGNIDTYTEAEVDAYTRSFHGLTQVQALVKIAKDSGNNRFKISYAKKLLLTAGLIKSKKNASNILHNAIQRSEKFKRVALGEYELIIPKLISSAASTPFETLKRVQSSS